ncbi:hypothetical protein ACFWMQ_01670 [Streptomyces sp. NPDC058372]|uniref:hypothetical protein n=1 Tax=Streptomyces sp. NPDC058372 TaxID=3346464 RepID=UPI0036596F0C
MVPALTMVIAWPVLGELPALLALAGGALCLLGVWISRRDPAPKPGEAPAAEAVAAPEPVAAPTDEPEQPTKAQQVG